MVAARAQAPAPGILFDDLRRTAPELGDFPMHNVVAGDLDGDGDQDLVFVGGFPYPTYGGPNLVYLNNGGTFTQGAPLAGFDETMAAALGDVDGDGDLDLLCANAGSAGQQNRLYINDGAGAFTDVTVGRLPLALDLTLSLGLGDLDGDGDLDIVFGNSGQNRLYLNNGAGVFADATMQLPAGMGHSRSIALGDIDADGDLDVVVGDNGQNRLYLNVFGGSFLDVTASRLPALITATRELALGDVDGDGDLDLVEGNSSALGEQNRLYLNNGAGVFSDATAAKLPVATDSTEAIALGDIDGDGDLDLVQGQAYFTPQNLIRLNDGSGTFSAAPGALPVDLSGTGGVTLVDVDADGDLDLACANSLRDKLFINDGAGHFVDGMPPPASSANTTLARAVATGDVDADGDVDVVVARNGVDVLLRNDGTGRFALASPLPGSANDSRCAVCGDVDGDGDLDVVVGCFGPANVLLLNDGTGSFAAAPAGLPTMTGSTTCLALGDLDGDGDLDLMVGNRNQQNRIHLNDGTGVFSDATAGRLPLQTDPTEGLVLADLDGDGDLDCAVANWSNFYGTPNRLYLNNGAGVFADQIGSQVETAGSLPNTDVVAGDFDGDGDLDLVFASSGGEAMLFFNDGNAGMTWALGNEIPPSSANTRSIVAGDFDGDGDLDLILGNRDYFGYAEANTVLINNGAGTFGSSSNLVTRYLELTTDVALADLDGDGDLDYLAVNDDVRVQDNLSRQVRVSADVHIGQPMQLDIYRRRVTGGGGDVAIVCLSTAWLPVPVDLPPLGALRIDPMLLLPLVVLPVSGDASISWAVPSVPGAVGLPIYTQALIGVWSGDLAFSNATVEILLP